MEEANALRQCQSPHVVQLYCIAYDEQEIFQLLMELAEPGSLRQVMRRRSLKKRDPFTIMESLEILFQACYIALAVSC